MIFFTEKHFIFCCLLFATFTLQAQNIPVQNIRGKVADADTRQPLIGASVFVISTDSNLHKGAATDVNGRFVIKNIPVGKYMLGVTYIGYIRKNVDIEVKSGVETVVNIALSESSIAMNAVKITAYKNRGAAMNEMAMVSARSFDVNETRRYAGSRADPARMVSNYAGVQGTDDSRNDIVVRGNSPTGVKYIVEGVDIPNPNHFNVPGSSGGPVSIINNKMLARSSFYTGAFPAEFGNTVSAVFDINLRNGNSYKHEFSGQFGILGTELSAEGPISRKSHSSYLIMGRYSTLRMFQSIGFQIGTDAVPTYGDGGFKFNFPLKEGGNIAWWGLGGSSSIDIIVSTEKSPPKDADLYAESDRDQYFATSMGVSGLTYSKTFGKKTFFTTTLACSVDRQGAFHKYVQRHVSADNLYVVDSIFPILAYKFKKIKAMWAVQFNTKLNKKNILQYGLNWDGLFINNHDSILSLNTYLWRERWNYKGFGMILGPYFQWEHRWKDKWKFTLGVHSNYFSLSNSWSYIEPRIGLEWQLSKKQTLSYGFGLHSQQQPTYLYTYNIFDANGDKYYHLMNMGFTKSIHNILGYNFAFTPDFKIKTEFYYEYIFNVPVDTAPSAFSLLNEGSGFSRFFPGPLKNTGTGQNYGVELTVEKFYDKSYFLLFTGSLYQSKYKGSDGIQRNTDFNGSYMLNVLGGKEFKIGTKQTLSAGFKITTAGGKRYGYVDDSASLANQDVIYKEDGYNSRQFKNYFRLDLNIKFRINAKRVTHEIGLDLINVLNTKNILGLTYTEPTATNSNPYVIRYQLGFLPLFYYRIDFSAGGRKKIKK